MEGGSCGKDLRNKYQEILFCICLERLRRMTKILSQQAECETDHSPLSSVSVTTFRFMTQMLSFPVGVPNKIMEELSVV
jgi:hypothetical protein